MSFLASRVLAGWPPLPPGQSGPAPVPATLDSIVSGGEVTLSQLELLADNLFMIDQLSPPCLRQRPAPSSSAGAWAGAGAGASAAAGAAAAPPVQAGLSPSSTCVDGQGSMRVFVRTMLATQIMHFSDMVAAGESPAIRDALITNVTKLGPAVAGINVSGTLCRWGNSIRASFAASNSHIVGGACASAGLERVAAALKHSHDALVGQFAALHQQVRNLDRGLAAVTSQLAALQSARAPVTSPSRARGASSATQTAAAAAGGSATVDGGASAADSSASAAGGGASAADSSAPATSGLAAWSAVGSLSSAAALGPSRTLGVTDPVSIFIEHARNESVGEQFTKQDRARIKPLVRAMLAAGAAGHVALVRRARGTQSSSSMPLSSAPPSDAELRIAANAMINVLVNCASTLLASSRASLPRRGRSHRARSPRARTRTCSRAVPRDTVQELSRLKEHKGGKGADYAEIFFHRSLTSEELGALITLTVPPKTGKR